MTDHAFIDNREPVERQNERLLKITEALIRRVERDTDETGNAYNLFQRAVALEGEVRARTQDLQRTLDELSLVNEKLEAATAIADEANRAKTRFLAAASHDVLQPLNAAKLFLGTLEATELDDKQKRITGRLRTAFNSVESLLGALLDISKLDSVEATAELSTFSISQILDPIAIEFSPLAKEQNVGFSVIGSNAVVQSDLSYLRRITQNLVSNAIRYCGNGRVLVGCRRQGSNLRLEVHDTGPGITAHEIPNIFREFHRLKTHQSSTGQGMGLGLAIVDRACRLLNHPLDISSVPGRGTVFSVTVPLQPPCIPQANGQAISEIDQTESLADLIAVILGASSEHRNSVARTMESWGASVISVASADMAVQTCEQLGLPPDVLLITDPIEVQQSFVDALNRVRAVYKSHVPAIIIGQEEASEPLSDFIVNAGISYASLNQRYRLRALLTWNQKRTQL